MNVFMFTPNANGGHARYTKELVTALAELPAADVHVSLVTSSDLDPRFETDIYPIHKILSPLRPGDAFTSRWAWLVSRLTYYPRRDTGFMRWLRRQPGDQKIVHFQDASYWMELLGFRQLRRNGTRVVYTVHNVHWHEYPKYFPPWLVDAFRRQALRVTDGLMVHTEALKQALSELLDGQHPPIFVTPHGAWSGEGANLSVEATSSRLARRRVLFFGILGHYKGVHVLLDALRHLPEEYTLTIAGNPASAEYRDLIRAKVAEFPEGRVELIDRFLDDEEIPELFAGSSLLALPYVNFNAQSGVLHDAITWGVPVVGTDVGAIGTSIREWGVGEVVEPDNAASLAAGILRTMEPDRYRDAVAGIDRVRTHLGWDRTAETTLAAYEAIVRSPAR